MIDEQPDRIVREGECQRISGASRATRWRWEREGRFPKRLRTGPNSVGWRLSELVRWIDGVAGGGQERL